MTGRGIDQVLPHPCAPHIYEPYMKSAEGYVALAERMNGPVPRPVAFSYIWGDALAELDRMAPDARVINLETAVTKNEDYENKGINYRMSPDNIPCITGAGIDCCSLANNHILDWGYPGLIETLETLKKAGLKTSGAGRDLREAESPAVIGVPGKGRVIVFSFGASTSGIPLSWAATEKRPGVNLLRDFSAKTVQAVKEHVGSAKKQEDIAVVSIHWGGNWGYDVTEEDREFAHRLIDEAEVDIVHGHSSHHVRGIEVHNGRLILYGCGDFLNDYEGISGFENYRGDLGLMYFVTADAATGSLVSLRMAPTRIKRLRVNLASWADGLWLQDTLTREGERFGTWAELEKDKILTLHW